MVSNYKRKNDVKGEYKSSLKRAGFVILCLFPLLIGFSVLFYFAGLPDWATILLIVCIGAILYVFIEILYSRHQRKKEAVAKTKPKKFDPFAD